MTPRKFSESEILAQKELKNRVENVLTPKLQEDDSLFSRFLTARNYDVDAAETMLRNHINWRKVNKTDTILSTYEYPQFRDTYFGQTRLGFDKEGSRVIYIDGSMDFKGLLKAYKKQEMCRYTIYSIEDDIEQMRIQTTKTGIHQHQTFYIYNVDKISVSTVTNKPVIDLLLSMAKMNDLNYPERMKTSVIINAPSIFTLLWSTLKPFLAPRTIEKIKVFGTEGWKEELLKMIDADVLPAFLGGTRTDPDGNPMCKTFVNHGLMVPEKYYIDKKLTTIIQNPNATKLVISRKSKSEVKLEVIHLGSTIEWEFELKSFDIGFYLLHKESANKNSKVTELIPFQRIETDLSPETGFIRCEKRGIYVLVFDNTYSWMHHKEIHYIVSVVGPNNSNRMS